MADEDELVHATNLTIRGFARPRSPVAIPGGDPRPRWPRVATIAPWQRPPRVADRGGCPARCRAGPPDDPESKTVSFFAENWILILVAFVSGGMLVWPLVNRAGGGLTVSTTDAVRLINREKGVLIDVSEANEYAAAHARGARSIPFGSLEGSKELPSNKTLPLILLCPTGARAGRAAALLRKAGHANAVAVSGGTNAWRDAALPTDKAADKAAEKAEKAERSEKGERSRSRRGRSGKSGKYGGKTSAAVNPADKDADKGADKGEQPAGVVTAAAAGLASAAPSAEADQPADAAEPVSATAAQASSSGPEPAAEPATEPAATVPATEPAAESATEPRDVPR